MKHRESTVSGTTWDRSYQVVIGNPLNGVPFISFKKERVTEMSDGAVTNTPIGEARADFTTPTAEFNLINPDTGDVLGTATHQQVYLMLYGLFLSLDTTPPSPPAPPSEG